MPPTTRVLTKLSKAQWKSLMQRLTERESPGYTGGAIDKAFASSIKERIPAASEAGIERNVMNYGPSLSAGEPSSSMFRPPSSAVEGMEGVLSQAEGLPSYNRMGEAGDVFKQVFGSKLPPRSPGPPNMPAEVAPVMESLPQETFVDQLAKSNVNSSTEQFLSRFSNIGQSFKPLKQLPLERKSVQDTIFSQEPPVTKLVGELTSKERGRELLPIAEARAKYFADPERYKPGGYARGVRELIPGGAEKGSAEELANQLAYRRTQQLPIVPSTIQKSTRGVEKEYERQAVEKGLGRVANLEDIRPEAKMKHVLAEKGGKPEYQEVPIEKKIQTAMVADELWRDMGGGRSAGAHLWEMYRKSSRQSSHISNSRDYFISSFVRWQDDPVKMTKAYPREAKLLGQVWDAFQKSLSSGGE